MATCYIIDIWYNKIRKCKLLEIKKYEWGNSYEVQDENKISHEVNDDYFSLDNLEIKNKFKMYLKKKIKENKIELQKLLNIYETIK